MESRLKDVMAAVLGIPKALINESSSPETIEEWDSIKQMNLVLAIEEEFDVLFSDEQIMEMLNYKLICAILRECNVKD